MKDKTSKPRLDLRQKSIGQDSDSRFEAAKRKVIERIRRVDPFLSNHTLARQIGVIVMGDEESDGFHLSQEELAAAGLIAAVKNQSADELEELFKAILRIKRAAENLPSRVFFAFAAYGDFIEQFNREPTKPELRKYISDRPKQYRDRPAPEDKKGWTRLWQDAGLFNLAER